MNSAYWTQIRLDAAGNCQFEQIPKAQLFCFESFLQSTTQSEVSDIEIQRQLVAWMRDEKPSTNPELAKLCLQCFISNQIEQACQRLVTQFGIEHGFRKSDLLPFVLDHDRRNHQIRTNKASGYRSLQHKILESFEPSQSSLATWTNKRVRHHRELNVFLLEHGIYLVSDWAILNDTSSKQLKHIYDVYHLTESETQQDIQLLESYHAVYRVQQLQQRQARNRSQCSQPTIEQLQQIAQRLLTRNNPRHTPEVLRERLQNLATRLREYRIAIRSRTLPTESLNESNSNPLTSTASEQHDEADEQTEFLNFYLQQRSDCLDSALKQVIKAKVIYLERKNPEKARKFLIALKLFHCQGKSMTEIAPLVDLAAQYNVTRLLQLKDLRADVRRQLLGLLRDRVVAQVQAYTNPEHLQKIDEAIDEDINRVLQESRTEASTPNPNRQITRSLFAERLCHLLDLMRTQND